MKKMTKEQIAVLRWNVPRLLIYMIGGPALAFVSYIGMIEMWCSRTFLVVYDKNWNVIPIMRFIRYGVYAALAIDIIIGCALFLYGGTFLLKRWQKRFGRC